MWWLFLSLAAAEEPASDEIIVWADRFARWERRWLVETEVRFPGILSVPADTNHQLAIDWLQVRAVLDCDRDVKLLGSSWEVHCTIEDISLVVVPARKGNRDGKVLRQTDAALTGAALQLQVSAKGGVVDVDVEGFRVDSARDRVRMEAYRQILSRVILPFHLGLPKVIHSGAVWHEHDSRLMTMPSSTGSGGSSTLAHYMNAYQGVLLVQTTGEGTLRPTMGVDLQTIDSLGMAGASSRPVDTYTVKMEGVAIFEEDTGIMSERVWAVDGRLTPSSPSVLKGWTYHHEGHLRLLGPGEGPEVGRTHLAKPPGSEGKVPDWVPLSAQE